MVAATAAETALALWAADQGIRWRSAGRSAALAISALLPKGKQLEQDTLFTVVAVTALSTMAMIFYPALFAMLGLSVRNRVF